MAQKQVLVEFSMKMFAHLKWPAAFNLLNNFWSTLASYHQHHKFALSKFNHQARLYQKLLKCLEMFFLHQLVDCNQLFVNLKDSWQ